MLMMTYFDDVGDLSVVIKQCRDEKKNLDEQLIWKVTTMLMMTMIVMMINDDNDDDDDDGDDLCDDDYDIDDVNDSV